MPPLKKFSRDSLVTDVQLICQQLMNDLLSIISGSTKDKNDQGRVFLYFKHVPVSSQKPVTKNMFLVHHENALFTIRWNMAVFIAFLDN